MLQIISKKDCLGLTPLYSFLEPSEEFQDYAERTGAFKEGLWLEYWENQVINFKFLYLGGIITVYSGNFSSFFTKEELKNFFTGNVHYSDILKWVNNEVSLEILDAKPSNSKEIKNIYKYDVSISFYDSDLFPYIEREKDDLFCNYYEYKIQNSKIIRCLPNIWGGFRFYSPEKDIDEKLYWINLCALKIYVTRKYSTSN